jgi:hypothetical protein
MAKWETQQERRARRDQETRDQYARIFIYSGSYWDGAGGGDCEDEDHS